jgi:hypothetical protein
MKRTLIVVASALLLAGCAGVTPTQQGAMVGALTGGVVGAATTHGAGTTKAAAIGAGIGAVTGGVLGNMLGREEPCRTYSQPVAPPPSRRQRPIEK